MGIQSAMDFIIAESFFNANSAADIELFLKPGNDINAVDSNGNNAIFGCRTLEAMDSLLSNGINIHHVNNFGQSVLFHQKNPEILKKMTARGLDISRSDEKGQTCIFGHYTNTEGLKELLKSGCDINHTDYKGNSILFLPLLPELLSLVIDAGCNVNHLNHSGKGFIETIYNDGLHETIISNIDKFEKRTLYVDFCNSSSALFLYELVEYGFNIEINKNHFTINSYISEYKDALRILGYISDINDVHIYKYNGEPIYKGINK